MVFSVRFCLWLTFMSATATASAAVWKSSNITELSAAISQAQSGDKIHLAEGVFELTGPLFLSSGVQLQGQGPDKTLLRAASSWLASPQQSPDKEDPSSYLLVLHKIEDITISNLALSGKALRGALLGEDIRNVTVKNVHFKDFAWSALRTMTADQLQVTGCRFENAGGKLGKVTGGALYLTYVSNSEFSQNQISRSAEHGPMFGFKGRKAVNCRFHHNTVQTSFAIEFPFENDQGVEIDHNVLQGTISIPKFGGGNVIPDGYSFWIHHNWIHRSYALEVPRNSLIISHNLFTADPQDEKGNLVTSHGGRSIVNGPTQFSDNYVQTSGRGIFWTIGPYSDVTFERNSIRVTSTTRQDGLFAFHPDSNMDSIRLTNNVIECTSHEPRSLLRDRSGIPSEVRDNVLINITADGDIAARNSTLSNAPGERLQQIKPLEFLCGTDERFHVNGWHVSERNFERPTFNP